MTSSLFTIVAVLIGRHWWKKPTHRFFLYYSLAAFLQSVFELSEIFACTNSNSTPELYQSNVCVVCYLDGILVLLVCWISAYLLLVGAFQLVRLRGWKVEAIAMATVLILPLACAWKPIYMATAPKAGQTYGCRLPVAGGSAVDVSMASVECLLLVVASVAAGVTFATLVAGSCQSGGSYHRSYSKAFKTLLPLFVFLLVANLAGFWRFALSVVVAVKKSCPAPVDAMRDLFPLTFVSLPVCYLFLVCRIRCVGEESASDSHMSIDTNASVTTIATDNK